MRIKPTPLTKEEKSELAQAKSASATPTETKPKVETITYTMEQLDTAFGNILVDLRKTIGDISKYATLQQLGPVVEESLKRAVESKHWMADAHVLVKNTIANQPKK